MDAKQSNNTVKPKLFTASYTVAFLISTLIFLVNYSLISVIPLLLTEKMGATPIQIGNVLGLSSLGIIFVRPLLGYALDKFGRKAILFSSLFLMGFTYTSFIFAKNPTSFLIFRLIQIIPFAAASTALTTIATDLIPKERKGEGLSYFTTASTLALAIGPAIGIALYSSKWYNLPFLVSGIGSFCCFILALFMKFSDNSKKQEGVKFNFRSLFEPKVLIISLFVGFGYMASVAMVSYGTLFANEINMPINKTAIAVTCFSIGLLLFRLITARTMDKNGPKYSGILSMTLLAIGLALVGILKSSTSLYFGSLAVGGGVGIILPTGLSMAVDVTPPTRRGLCTGLIYLGIDIGHSIGAALFGILGDYYKSYSSAYNVFAVIMVAALFFFVGIVYPLYKREKIKFSGEGIGDNIQKELGYVKN